MRTAGWSALVTLFAVVAAHAGDATKAETQETVPPARPASTPADLFRAVALQDAALFDAYNRCDLDKFSSFFVTDVEFYHDKGGITRGSKDLTDSVKKNICGKVTRELVADSLEVYPMDNYGALETGVHRFHHPNDKAEADGEGRFIMLWQYDKTDATWQVTRVISFDHHTAK